MDRLIDEAEEELKAVFKQVDKDNDGRITKEELETAMHELGSPATEDQIDKMMKEADVNENGSLNFQEFSKAWNGASGDQEEAGEAEEEAEAGEEAEEEGEGESA